MKANRTHTGAEELDSVIGGGFPGGSLIVIAGNPGTGKTVFSAQFLYRGAAGYGENGMYVSFAESRESFSENMLGFGFNFERLEKEGKFAFLDMITVKEEGVSPLLERVIGEINRLEVRRLVIDSFSAMAQAFKEPIEARVIVHLILGKMVRQMGCTTILISEIPTGEERIGLGIEEFVADGLIRLRTGELDGRLLRDLKIVKLRGTELSERKLVFTLKGGFTAFRPFRTESAERRERFKPLPDPPGKFSTGSQELDRLLYGGIPKGSAVLVQVDEQISTSQYHLVMRPAAWNFAAKRRAVMIIPSSGVDTKIIKLSAMEGGFTTDEVNRLLRVCTFEADGNAEETCVLRFRGKSAEEDFQRYFKVEEELMSKTGEPVMHIVGADSLISYYGRETMMRMWNLATARVREKDSIGMIILKPTYTEAARTLAAMADVHLKITREHGALMLYGVKPRTGLYVVETDSSHGYTMPKLTSIV